MIAKRFPLLFLFFSVLLLGSCSFPSGEPNVSPTATLSLPTPTASSVPPTTVTVSSPTPEGVNVVSPQPDTVALDFVAQACNAQWANNTYQLPCPGQLDEIEQGYIAYSNHAIAEGMLSVDAPLLVALPGQGDGNGIGLFGRYPALTILPGDTFRATIACQENSSCDTEFALEYFDEYGAYHHSGWAWTHQAGDGPQEIFADLSSLAGQSVELMLVAREQGNIDENWLLWIQPYIERNPNAEPLSLTTLTPTSDEPSQVPGVISGVVDMSTSPPYLTDPMKSESTLVVVTFFNLNDGTYWYIPTSLTGHPNYQMTVPPGRYEIVAYARGVGDEPYVTAGYTGQNPSCGQALQPVDVAPNARIENIIIADWNWTCGGTASRPKKPADVPVP